MECKHAPPCVREREEGGQGKGERSPHHVCVRGGGRREREAHIVYERGERGRGEEGREKTISLGSIHTQQLTIMVLITGGV